MCNVHQLNLKENEVLGSNHLLLYDMTRTAGETKRGVGQTHRWTVASKLRGGREHTYRQ
jgi:hypothetical protein